MNAHPYPWLVLLGLLVGTYGTLIGAGGGFVLVPVLLLLYPQESPTVITSISLAVVFFNAASGSIAYARMRRIDYPAAAVFSAATVPGAIGGALATSLVDRRFFDPVLGSLMTAAAVYLLYMPTVEELPGKKGDGAAPSASNAGVRRRQFTLGAAISVFVGAVSSFLGIGGGIVHVPLLVRVLKFPVHRATATSHLVLAVMALVGTLTHVVSGGFEHGIRRTAALAVGVVVGAQLGARLSTRVHGTWILRGLALALGLVGLRLLFHPV